MLSGMLPTLARYKLAISYPVPVILKTKNTPEDSPAIRWSVQSEELHFRDIMPDHLLLCFLQHMRSQRLPSSL